MRLSARSRARGSCRLAAAAGALSVALLHPALWVWALQGGAGSVMAQTAGPAGAARGGVRINELLSRPAAAEPGGARGPDWLELHNEGAQEARLEGWRLSDGSSSWAFPAGTALAPGGYLLVYAAGKGNSSSGPSVEGTLRAAFKLGGSGLGEPLLLLAPDGTTVSRVDPVVGTLRGVSFGIPGDSSSGVTRDPQRASPMTHLEAPTPGAANAGPRALGPHITRVSLASASPPAAGEAVSVSVTACPNLHGLGALQLVYAVGLGGQEASVEAQADGPAGPGGCTNLTAAVPASAATGGALIRWRVAAVDSAGYASALPPAEEGGEVDYAGGVMVAPPPEQLVTQDVPVLEWFSPDPATAVTREGAGDQVLYFGGRLFQGVTARRRGVTSLGWPKPKLKFELQEAAFLVADDLPPVSEFGLQSFWYELGERSYMKETLALQFMRAAGVLSPASRHVHVRLNGAFYGLFALVEVIDREFLEARGLPSRGTLLKSVSGELSNLRWDLPRDQMPSFWEDETGGTSSERSWQHLADFSSGLAGGGPVPRSRFVFDAVNLPATLNNMAAQAIVNNMDRCTKNFYIYLHPVTQEWYMLPWDLDGSFGQDNGLGGKPDYDKYCVLACEQWNSPLYCDSEHPQDLTRATAWGSVTVPLNPGAYAGPAVQRRAGEGRRMLQAPAAAGPPPASDARAARARARSAASSPAQPLLAAGRNITAFPAPQGWSDPDRVTVGSPSRNDAPGTYNHLVDALLDTNATRAMYLRRLRTLADLWLAGGRLAALANATHAALQPLAAVDATKWNSGIDAVRGYAQITSEFLPIRTEQLLGGLYGPNGTRPLLPPPQSDKATVALVRMERPPAPAASYLELSNPSDAEVDVSDWQLRGAASFKFAAGTVLPPRASSYVATDLPAFRARAQAPRGGMGLLVVGPLAVSGAGAGTVELVGGGGAVVARLQVPAGSK